MEEEEPVRIMNKNKSQESSQQVVIKDSATVSSAKVKPSQTISINKSQGSSQHAMLMKDTATVSSTKVKPSHIMSKNKSQESSQHSVLIKDTATVSTMKLQATKLSTVHSLISQHNSIINREVLEKTSVEHTLAMIKPDGMGHEREILLRFKKEGFIILAKRRVHLTPEQVSDFYHDLYGNKIFPLLVASTSSAPVAVYCLGRPNAVEKLLEVVGPCDVNFAQKESPQCLNAQFGNADCNFPAVHASCEPISARREIQFFFPQGTTEREKRVAEGLEFLEREVQPLLREGLAQLLKEKPAEPMLWLAAWLLKHNPNKPSVSEHLRHQHFYPSKHFDN